jgi:hypothetical protein
MTDVQHVQQALGCTPDLALLALHDLHCQRAFDALHRPRCAPCPPVRGGGDFIDFTQEEDPNVND